METENQPAPTNKLKLILLISLPLVLIFSLIVLFGISQQRKSKQYKEERSEEVTPELEAEIKRKEAEEIAQVKKTLTYAPLNPTSATATCQSTGEALVSGQATSCPDPVFTWSGEKTREEGAKIIGYWVYFGPNNNTEPLYYYGGKKAGTQDITKVVKPIIDGEFQENNEFAPINLEKDKTYYLAVSAKSDSKDEVNYLQYGITDPDVENHKAKAADILFTFIYE